MDFFILLVVNIFIGAIVYLVISLKLEKSASTFREKKLRKEMDEIIKEFNAAAERNISLLENRISVAKRLLDRTGDMKKIDIFDENEMRHNSEGDVDTLKKERKKAEPERGDSSYSNEQHIQKIKTEQIAIDHHSYQSAEKIRQNGVVKKSLILFENMFTFFGRKIVGEKLYSEKFGKRKQNDIQPVMPVSIEKDFSTLEPVKPVDDFSDEALLSAFSTTADKYSLIEDLYCKGCPVDLLAFHSGIPAGEIKLVLNLKGARQI